MLLHGYFQHSVKGKMSKPVIIFAAYIGNDNPYFLQLSKYLKKNTHLVIPNLKGYMPFLRAKHKHPKSSVIHLHWLTSTWMSPIFIRSIAKSLQLWFELFLLKVLNTKIIWTIHNLHHHEKKQPLLEKLNQRIVWLLADQIVVHSQQAKKSVIKQFGKKAFSVIPHSSYLESYPNTITKTEAKQTLALKKKEKVILFFGTIRPYKGVELLIESFKQMNQSNTVLVIAGWVSAEYKKTILKSIGNHHSIHFFPGKIPPNEVQTYFKASDIVVLPFKDVLNSGSLLLAFSFAKPVIATNLGVVSDLLSSKGGFLYDPKKYSLEYYLKKAIKLPASDLDKMGTHNVHIAQRLNPKKEALEHLEMYKKVCNSSY